MSALLKLAVLLFFMVLLPVLAGAAADRVICGPGHAGIRPGTVLRGYFLSFALCEAVALPVLFLTPLGDFVLFARIYAALLCIAAAAGLFFLIRDRKSGRSIKDAAGSLGRRLQGGAPLTYLFAAAALILFFIMLCKAYRTASFDGDDAYYVTQSVLSWQTGTMYRYLPYTGITTSVDMRHAMALFPMWTAALASYSGIHPTIVAHSIEPLAFITLSALVFLRISGGLFGEGEEADGRRAAFMTVIFLLWIFGYVSLYTPETFLLTRTWQGKSMLANLLLPAGLYCLLRAGKHPEERAPYAEAFLLCLCSGLFTSMAPALLLLFMAAGAFFLALTGKDRRIIRGFLPAIAAALAYLVMILTA